MLRAKLALVPSVTELHSHPGFPFYVSSIYISNPLGKDEALQNLLAKVRRVQPHEACVDREASDMLCLF